jgi:hypothetical protein
VVIPLFLREGENVRTSRIKARPLPFLLVAGLVVGITAGTAAAASNVRLSAVATPRVRTVKAGHTLTFPEGNVGQGIQGIQNPEIPAGPPGGDKDANRSLSARPSTKAGSPAYRYGIKGSASGVGASPRWTTGASFEALNLYEERYVASDGNQFTFEPPDQGLCAGNGFELETVNEAIQVFDTSGNPVTDPTGLNEFLGYPPAIDRTTGVFGPQTTDPACAYDPVTQRWFVDVLTLETDPDTGGLTLFNHVDIAVSTSSDPAGSWVVYQLPVQDDGTQGTPVHVDCPCIGDYPHIGVDAYGVHVTTNEYPWSSDPGKYGNNFNGSQFYIFSKSQLVANDDTVTVDQFESPELAGGIPAFTPWPANVPGGAYDMRLGGSEWFMESTAAEEALGTGVSSTLGVWRMYQTQHIDSQPNHVFLQNVSLESQSYAVPPQAEQKVGYVPLRDCTILDCYGIGASPYEVEGPIDQLDSRMQQTWLANGFLYGATGTQLEVAGRLQAGISYFVVRAANQLANVFIRVQGYVAGPANENVSFPAIATLSNGSGVMAMNLIGPDWYPTAAYMAISNHGVSGPIVVVGQGVGPEDGFCEYNAWDCAGNGDPPLRRPRWGDYAAAAEMNGQLWIASQYINQTCDLDTYLADTLCGNTRGALANWSTHITQLSQ